MAKATPKPEPKQRYLVAEVGQTWHPGVNYEPKDHVGAKFEQVCRWNAERGYRLHSWRLASVAHDEPLSHAPTQVRRCIQETIVAVFELETTLADKVG